MRAFTEYGPAWIISLGHSTDKAIFVHLPTLPTPQTTNYAGTSSDVRMDRVNSLRAAFARGNYIVSSSDLAEKLMETMWGGPMLRSRNEVGLPSGSPSHRGIPTHGFTHATFRSPQASESAEEVNHE